MSDLIDHVAIRVSDLARSREFYVTRGVHVAFRADDAESVIAFHAAAVAHGGRSIGEPGPRPEYSEGYFGAFVLDPDGNNTEAVWHAPEALEPGG